MLTTESNLQSIRTNQVATRAPQPTTAPVIALAEQFNARISGLRDQLGRVLSTVDPSGIAPSANTAQPQQAGIYGQLSDGLDTLSIVEKQVAELGARLSG